ncbi:MAG: NifB/NifX family molybdenum-iron cluster-binding protein [Nanobdellota archaeon]
MRNKGVRVPYFGMISEYYLDDKEIQKKFKNLIIPKSSDRMIIAFAVQENKGIDSTLARHFGRCPYYIFIDSENEGIKDIKTKENPFLANHNPGDVPKFISENRADVMIAGGMGPKAISWFNDLGINTITTTPKKIDDLLDDYFKGNLGGADSCRD